MSRSWSWTIAGFVVVSAGAGSAQVTQRVSVSSSGAEGNGYSDWHWISADGRYVAFRSIASNLVAGDTNGATDVFVRDRQSGTTERVSLSSGGAQANGSQDPPTMTPDGRYVAFHSTSTNLVTGDTNGSRDVFLRDRQSSTTERVSVASNGAEGNHASGYVATSSISADGRYVAFESQADNLASGDTNLTMDVFVRDRQNGTTERVSLDSSGAQGTGFSFDVSLSADGRYVAFRSTAPNLVPGDTNGFFDVFVRDRQNGTTERVSVHTSGTQGNGACGSIGSEKLVSMSADGRYVAFASSASNLVPADSNTAYDVFVRDRQSGTTERVSVESSGIQGNSNSGNGCISISADGRYVTFESAATNLVAGDTNGQQDVFLHDRQSGATQLINIDCSGAQGNHRSVHSSISADGRYVAFDSFASNLFPVDMNSDWDVFVHDRLGGPSFSSLCDPGSGGVIACPCANPPSAAGRGCDNSSNTGGAALSASGGTYLSSDCLVFTTSGEKPTATSIVAQWTGNNPSGAVFGMGVRCTSGTLKRLYTKMASGGSITAPDFGAGDPQVSVRSATLGNTISAGQSRWYLVYYRDPILLGGCPASSSFNATQTGLVVWAP